MEIQKNRRPGRPPKSKDNISEASATYNTKQTHDDEATDDYMTEKYKTIGENIRRQRKSRNFSIENLAEYIELSASYIGLLERGERSPSLKSLYKICDLFSCTPNDILMEKSDSTASKSSLSIQETKKVIYQNKYNAVISLLKNMDQAQLNFLVSVLKGMKDLEKSDTLE